MAYRAPEPTVRVERRPSAFWLRLRVELKGLRLWASALWALPVPAVATLIASWVYRDEPVLIFGFSHFGLFATVFLLLFGVKAVPDVAGAILASMVVNPLERDLPGALVFRASGIRIEPAEGEPYERRWPYFHEAWRTARGIELVLSRQPYLVFAVARAQLRRADFERLDAWLVENQLLRQERRFRRRGAGCRR